MFDNHATSGAGICNYEGTVTIEYHTLTGNEAKPDGGGIFNGDQLTLGSLIVAGNSAAANPNIRGGSSGASNLVAGDPRLAQLGDYGGPTTTRPPLAGSPALGVATSTVPANDQRGALRPIGSGPDLGAVEMPDGGYEPPRITRWSAAPASGEFVIRWANTRMNHVVESSANLAFGEPADRLIPDNGSNGSIDLDAAPGGIEFRFGEPSASGPSHFWRIQAD